MPVYDYQCPACGHRFELRQGFDAASEQPCPRCEGPARRLFHAVGIIYKGSGFYTTDYKRTSGDFPSTDGEKADPGAKEEEKKAETPAGTEE